MKFKDKGIRVPIANMNKQNQELEDEIERLNIDGDVNGIDINLSF